MNDILMRRARVSNIINDDDVSKVVVQTHENIKEILNIGKNTKVYEDELFLEKTSDDLELGYPLYIYTRENSPIMLSNPPQYTPLMIVVALNDKEPLQVSGFFDENLENDNHTVRINEALLEEQGLVKEDIINKELIVFYYNSTRSIPAIINPVKIIVL